MKAGWEKQGFVLHRADTVSRALQTRLFTTLEVVLCSEIL